MKSNMHVLITGKVQGVWFRTNTKDKADGLGINGWIRNTSDGKVEALFQGKEEDVKEMINWCHQGPPLAKVEKVDIQKNNSDDACNGFSVKY